MIAVFERAFRCISRQRLLEKLRFNRQPWSVCLRTGPSLRDLSRFSHFSPRWSAGLSSFAPPGLDALALRSTAMNENEFSRTHW